MGRAISTAPEPTRSREEIVDDIMREFGGARGESLILSEADTRTGVLSFVTRLTAGARKWSREYRKAEADCAQGIDDLLTELESKLKDPLAPRFNAQVISTIGSMRESCQAQMQFRPKDGREFDHLKHYCARSARHLMQSFSRRKISGSAETSFPVVTALLFESTTGKRDANVKRACDATLRHRRD